jgi:CRP/FNR family transcriptional regulator, nitrogen oxide reductase regulator
MEPSNDTDHLSQVPLFKGLSLEEMHQITKIGRLRHAKLDEFYFFQGDPADSIFILRDGRVKLTQITTDGQQILLRIIVPWTLFAIVGLVSDRVYPVSAQVSEPASAYVWKREELMGFIHLYPRLATNAMQLMAGYVQEFQDRLREMATERVERRLARTLIRLANQSGKKTEEGVQIDLQLSRQDLAEMIGTTLYTVSRILSQWETAGLIVSGRERVVIRNPHGLVLIAEDN